MIQGQKIFVSVVILDDHRAINRPITQPTAPWAKPMDLATSCQMSDKEFIAAREIQGTAVLGGIDRLLERLRVVCESVTHSAKIERSTKGGGRHTSLEQGTSQQYCAANDGGKGQAS